MDNKIGTVLDSRYELRKLIGSGGMANVYEAMDLTENRIVAVKILKEEFARNEEFVRRFKNETNAIALLSHENIVAVYDVGLGDQVQYIVMELLRGITLKDYINQVKIVPWKEACYFTMQILRGLQHAHSKGVVHRDIKPQNIMLLENGTIKIADFGIARFARHESVSVAEQGIGSVHYISPEQARGDAIDALTDLYSVGVMLFEMLTGQLPFEADTPISVARKQIESEPASVCALNPEVPVGLEAITMRAMQKNPRMRYASAQAMLEEIERFLQDPEHFSPTKPEGENNEVKNSNKEPSAPKQKKDKSQKPLPVIPIMTGIAAAFVLASVLFIVGILRINNPFQSPDSLRVPSFIGLTYDGVMENKTYQEDFNIQVEEESYQEGFEVGTIYHQEPKEGRVVKKGSIVTIRVVSAPPSVVVEDYSGQKTKDVYARLDELGVKYTEQKVNHPSIAPGRVIKTDPAVGTALKDGDSLTVYVSMGSVVRQAEVPDLTGLTVKEAKEKLIEAGLKLGDREVVADAQEAKGKVIGQEPAKGTMIKEGERVNLKVSGNDKVRHVAISVPLPDNNSQVTMQAFKDGEKIAEETVNTKDSRTWRVVFEGEKTAKIEIRMNSVVYKRYLLNFDEAVHAEIP